MPKLGEFIGTLLTEAAQARMRADMEILKIAEMYSSHHLLKHLPVPRFRLPEIHVDVPVVVSSLKDPQEGGGAKTAGTFTRKQLGVALGRALEDAGIDLPDAALEKAAAATHQDLKEAAEAGAKGPPLLPRMAKRAAATAAKEIAKLRPEAKEKVPRFEARAMETIRELLAAAQVGSPHLEVRVASGDIKAVGNNESITRFRFTLMEDSYEMIQGDDDQPGFKLVPE